ncbi:Flp pilus assembly protein CpaB [Halodesulfovibrio marinisediminis]|uniref:Pilus assembly protein CpaB n=1 Tax=Halodesulfovibrio marinisediminis DSM 17456 TaxID=1121457 RepID=A0A1N6EAR9_9BACT|nr:Flp pilus assembly protein CpaB [Halodesulfovibrio marinisediminis]SIN80007.1 pilus assembly protein CpaB [Halodesulfovibrio marinisediminis DSM 17456]
MNKRLIVQLSIAALFAIIAGYLTISWMQSYPEKGKVTVKQDINTVPVIVAAVTIPPGTLIDHNMLTVKEYLPDNKPEHSFATKKEVVGRVSRFTIYYSEPITDVRLASTDIDKSGVGALIAPGKRAMAVKGNKVLGLSGLIHPGDTVDVLATLRVDNNTITKVVLENLKVLATGQKLSPAADGKEAAPVDVYTLEVTPEEGEVLALAASSGSLHFALRHSSDEATVFTSGADSRKALSSFRGGKVGQKQEEMPSAGHEYEVEVLRGNKVNIIRIQ